MQNDRLVLSRRALLQKAGAGALALSCGIVSRAAVAQDAAVKGGLLRLGVHGGSTTDSLDPGSVTDRVGVVQMYTTYNCLVELDQNKRPIPELAESWEPNSDATQWVFRLRRGVEFHNGKTMSADDVVYSLRRHIAEGSTSGAQGVLAHVADIKKSDDYEVTLALSEGDVDLPAILGDYFFVILPDGFDDWRSGIGTGPFELVSYDPGVRSQHRRNQNYWKPDRAHVDEVELLVINDTAARITALHSGSVDVINRIGPSVAAHVQRQGDIELVLSQGGLHYTLPMAASREPFSDNNVRLALKYAIDREQVVQTLLRGYGRVGNDHPISEVDPAYYGGLEQRVYDPDRARHHLRQAGLDRLSVDLYASEGAFVGGEDLAALYMESARDCGIDINVIRAPADGYWSEVWMNRPFVQSHWSGKPTAAAMYSSAYACDAAWNEAFWCNERFEGLLREAKSELNEMKRAEIFAELQQIVRDEGGSVIPVSADWIDAHSTRVHGFEPDQVFDLSGARVAERVWIAEP